MRREGTTNQAGTGWKRAGAIALLISLLAVIVTVTLPRKRLLLSRAQHAAPASLKWAGKFRVIYPYYWLSDQKVMTLQLSSVRRFVLPAGLKTNAVSIDVATGRYQPLPALRKTITTQLPNLIADVSYIQVADMNHIQDAVFFIDVPCRVSPDGQWVILTETTGNRCWGMSSFKSRNTLAAVNGSHLISGKWMPGETHTLWEADSRHWKEWRWSSESGLETETYALDGTCRIERVLVPASLANYDLKLCAVTPAGTFLTEIEKREPEDVSQADTSDAEKVAERCSCELVELTMRSGTPLRRFAPCLPNVTKVTGQEIVVSPRCNRIAWLVTHRCEVTGPRLWRRIRARLGEKPHLETAIWISNLDGSSPHEVGYMPHQPNEASPRQLAWLPGGKQLSFSYRGDLYTVPAD